MIALISLSMSTWAQKEGDNRHGRGHHGKHGEHRNYDHRSKNSTLADKVYRITQADSIQAKKMKPIIDKASNRLKILKADFKKKEKMVLDSLNQQLKPLLKDDQKKRLDDFNEKKGTHRSR
jgi:hypothetical protein